MISGVKISQLPAVPSAATTDIYPVVQAGVTYKESISQLITLLNGSLTGFVHIAGDTMTGPLILSQDPTLPLMAATKEYVDQFASGIQIILAAECATTANLNATFAHVDAGVGTTLTNAGAMAALVIDGFSVSVNDRVLVKNQTLPAENGVYRVSVVGSGAVNWVLVRATDYDQAPSEVKPGTLVPVNNGTANATTSWLETATVITMDTDPILFSQFTFNPSAFLLRANNLSDLASAPTALINLGLGVPTGTGNVVLQTSPTLITPTLGAATATSLAFSPTTGGIIGTNTNNNASAGFVGEYIESSVAANTVPIASGGIADVTSIPLSPGDWDVYGTAHITCTANAIFVFTVWTNTVSATIPLHVAPSIESTLATFDILVLPASYLRVSIAAPTTVFLSAQAAFTSGTAKLGGFIAARRVR